MRAIPREVQAFNSKKAAFKLSDIQREVLIGTLLGDGALKKRGKYHRLHIKHSVNQLPFVEYKREIFSNIVNMQMRVFAQKVGEKEYSFVEFVTLTHPEFSKFYFEFYKGGKKTISQQIAKQLTPLSLAVWFMDDGCAEYAGLSFNTQCFSLDELQHLSKRLREAFMIETSIRRNKNGWIIYIPKRYIFKFRSIVEGKILDEFRYKLTPYSLRTP